jgi:DNA (cytosine-5)-methyltransferase 1
MAKPRLLDLFCGAGGAAMGYARAGFEVVGVDIAPQPRFPFVFWQDDALKLYTDVMHRFDVVHASPPCQIFSAGAGKWGTRDRHVNLIPAIRDRLRLLGVPYVIENIEPARRHLHNPTLLCGTMFDLGVYRHRYFESTVRLDLVLHQWPHPGKIGDGHYVTVTGHAGGSSKRDGWKGGSTEEWRRAMGIDWMTGNELKEAVPPAYTEWIGRQLIGGWS